MRVGFGWLLLVTLAGCDGLLGISEHTLVGEAGVDGGGDASAPGAEGGEDASATDSASPREGGLPSDAGEGDAGG